MSQRHKKNRTKSKKNSNALQRRFRLPTFAEFFLEDRTVPTNFNLTNTTPILIPGAGTSGNANPYPSTVTVSVPAGEQLTSLQVTFNDLSHVQPDNIDAMLIAPDGTHIYLMSDAGGGADQSINGVTLTFDDNGVPLTTNQIASGSYRPTNLDQGDPDTISGSPATPAVTTLAAFKGINPNGVWELRVSDDEALNSGVMQGGWTLTGSSRVNSPPVANNDSYSVNEDNTLTVTAAGNPHGVLFNDTDIDADTLSAILVTGTSHGALTLNADGGFTYVPHANYNGPDTFTYKVTDGITFSNTATVTITVNSVNDVPVANNDSLVIQNGGAQTIHRAVLLNNDIDPDQTYRTTLYFQGFESMTLQPWNTGTTTTGDGTDWTDSLPAGWNRDNTTTPPPPSGTAAGAEFFGWHAMDIDSWVLQQGDQSRSLFTRGGYGAHGTVMVGDGDAYDDFVSLANTHINTFLTTPNISLAGINVDTLKLELDSSFRPEDPDPGNQVGRIEVSFDNGANWTTIQDLNFANSGGVAGSVLRANEHLNLDINNLSGAATAKFRFGYLDAGNDWWWAIDNIKVSGGRTTPAQESIQIQSQPSQGSVSVDANGAVIYTPPSPTFTGTTSFTYRLSDGAATSNTATVTLTVNGNNTNPVAVNDTLTTTQGVTLATQYDLSVLANDTDVDLGGGNVGAKAILVAAPPAAQGTVTLNQDGTLVFVPNPLFVGNASFTYKMNDGSRDSNTATVTIAVTQINNFPPVAVDDNYSINNISTLTVNAPGVLGNDTDADGNPLVAQLVAGPTAAQGALTFNADGSFNFVPTAFFAGTATFTYRVFDGAFTSNTATVTITVSAVGSPPVAGNDSYSINNNGTLTVSGPGVLGNDTDPNGDPLTALPTRGPNGLVVGPNHGTLTFNADGSFVYVPRPFFNGTDSFTYRASDTSNLSNLATVTITVNAANVAPQSNYDTYYTTLNTPLTVTAPGVLRNDQDDGVNVQLYLEGFEGLTLGPWNTGTTTTGDGTDWTDSLPTGWVRNNTNTPPPASGTAAGAEFFGWHAMDADSWAAQQGNQERSDFTRGGAGLHGTVLVADGDAYTDFVSIGSNRINSLLETPSIALGAISPNSLTLEFDSSFRPEDPAPANQVGRVEVSYDNGTTWRSLTDFRTENSGGPGSRQRTNEHVTVDAFNPSGATTAKFRIGYLDAGNDWWWAIDNVKASGRTPNAGANLTAQLVAAPPASQGTVALNANGGFTFTPATGFAGVAKFTYRTNDGVSNGAPTTVSVLVGSQAALQVNDGSAQRSRVTSLQVTFAGIATFANTQPGQAFTLMRGATAVPFQVTSIDYSSGATVLTLSAFSGSTSDFGSLADGHYTLTTLSGQVSINGQALDGDGNGTPGGDYVANFHRFFGDVNGDEHVDILDYGVFGTTYLRNSGDAGFLGYLDKNNDGHIDILDYGQFGIRYLTVLP